MTDHLSNERVLEDWVSFARDRGIDSDAIHAAIVYFAVPIGALKLRAKEAIEEKSEAFAKALTEIERQYAIRDHNHWHRRRYWVRRASDRVTFIHLAIIGAFLLGVWVG